MLSAHVEGRDDPTYDETPTASRCLPVAAMIQRGTVAGVNVLALGSWFQENVPHVVTPLHVEQIGGGRSNLTFKIVDARRQAWVLRRPPLGQVLSTAHDMEREWRAISALSATSVPVPEPIAICGDEQVIGASFYVMRYVHGHILRDADAVAQLLPWGARPSCAQSLVRVLATLHLLDPDEVGLGNHGRRDGYVVRQLHRWYRQWKESRVRHSSLIEEVYGDLLKRVPAQGSATIVHGDYRLDNTIVDKSGTVRAVLDWELSTLGDPLADLASLLVQWDDPNAPTSVGGFPEADVVLDLYGAQTERSIDDIQFYVAFCQWRLACILEGVYARYRAGVMGMQDVSHGVLAEEAEQRAEASWIAFRSYAAGSA
jgi:aminoglycoside phosphotransferase (APT) family kinase protein